MKTLEIQIAIAKHFGIREYMIVPNISWGLDLHECDLLIVSKSRWATEVEIKTSEADLIADKLKPHKHDHKLIKHLYFAVPWMLMGVALANIPENAGLLIVYDKNVGNRVSLIREPKTRPDAMKLTDHQYMHLGHLASMRIWSLKNQLSSYKQ